MGSTVAVPADKVAITNQIDYCGNMVYENGILKMILTDEGYIDMSTSSPQYCYYIKDHQGNNRVVENKAGVVLQSNHYYPFGMTFGEGNNNILYADKDDLSWHSFSNYKYNGKELDRMHGLDLYDYGARMYDSAIGRWGTMDPLAEKYYSISPYAYCGNNPVRFVDPDGKKIVFANGVSEHFKKDYAEAKKSLIENNVGNLLMELESSSKVYSIAESTTRYSFFDSKEKTINWSSRTGLLTPNGIELSPTTLLNHEIDHAVRNDKDPEGQKKDHKPDDSSYGNKEEKRVIVGSEQDTAKALGEIKHGEVTRAGISGGRLYETTSAISTQEKEEIICKPKNNK